MTNTSTIQQSPTPVALLRRTGNGPRSLGLLSTPSRSLVLALLERMTSDRLSVEDLVVGRRTYGPGGGLEASVKILDQRAWSALVREGSVGLGRGFIEGWWHSDDPVAVVRIIIRNIEWLDSFRNSLHRWFGWLTDPLRRLLPSAGRRRNREDISTHYDLSNEFFSLFLDETMTYSSAIFPDQEASLAEGSLHKYDLLLSKLGVRDSHHVLEIGTGWGGFALRAVDKTGCRVTTTTISANQLEEAKRRVAASHLVKTDLVKSDFDRRITLLDRDWRDLTGRYDRIVSIEMIEAVHWKDYERFFATIEARLADDGVAALQAICVPDRRFERTKKTEDFIRRFVFPGGFLPSTGAIGRALTRATKLQIVDVADYSAHYAETLRRWRARFETRIDAVMALGFDERFCRLWSFYLAYCEAAFLERHCTVNQVVLAGKDWRPSPH